MQQFQATSTRYQAQLTDKKEHITRLFSPLYNGEFEVFESPIEHYRARAEFRVWHDGDDLYHIMFDQQTKEKYRVDSFPVAITTINILMTAVIEEIKLHTILRKKLFQIDYLSGQSGETVISLLYHKPLDEEWTIAIQALRNKLNKISKVEFVGRARKQKILANNDFIIETLNVFDETYHFKHIENSFTQPNPLVNEKMIEWCLAHTQNNNDSDLLEFYCGAGNFSIPLAKNFRQVIGTEISRTSVNAAQHNIDLNQVQNVFIARMSSEEFTDSYRNGTKSKRLSAIDFTSLNISTVLVDPPRAGLDDATIELIRAYDRIIYISCNPNTLLDNLNSLATSHDVVNAAIFDQFPYTEHIEIGVILKKR